MNQRTYHGRTLGEALIAMKSDLGEDAVLVGHRKVKTGSVMGMFGKEVVEVTGEVMPEWMKKERSREEAYSPPSRERLLDTNVPVKKRLMEAMDGLGINPLMASSQHPEAPPRAKRIFSAESNDITLPPVERDPVSAKGRPVAYSRPAGPASPFTSRNPHSLRGESAPLSSPTQNRPLTSRSAAYSTRPVVADSSGVHTRVAPRPSSQQTPLVPQHEKESIRFEKILDLPSAPNTLHPADEVAGKKINKLEDAVDSLRRQMSQMIDEVRTSLRVEYPGSLGEFYLQLTQMGLSPKNATAIIQEVAKKSHPDELNDREVIEARLRQAMAGRFSVASPLLPRENGPTVIVAVGPTGVGKTTTLAKLGAQLSLDEKRSIAFVTLDTYRIAAVDQLRRYSEILDVPLEEALTPGDLSEALEMHSEKEFILVDTAGRSPKNDKHLQDLKDHLEAAQIPLSVCLCLCAEGSDAAHQKIFEKFSVADPSRVIITKVDETDAVGNIVNIMSQTDLPLAYITTGQNVPDDIEVADARRLAQRILKA